MGAEHYLHSRVVFTFLIQTKSPRLASTDKVHIGEKSAEPIIDDGV